jgi:hypothetical protein
MTSPNEQNHNPKSEQLDTANSAQRSATESMKNSILSSIEKGSVKMRPRWEFILRAVGMYLGLLVLAIGALYAISFVVFMLRQSGIFSAYSLGFNGFLTMLGSLSWFVLVVAVAFAILLVFTIRKYSFGYAWPFLYLAIGTIVIVLIGGVIIGDTSLHQQLQTVENHLPLAGGFYQKEFDNLPQNFTVGRITAVTSSGYTMEDSRYGQVTIIISPQTQLPAEQLKVGERIFVLGQRVNNTVRATAVSIATRDPRRDSDDMLPAI